MLPLVPQVPSAAVRVKPPTAEPETDGATELVGFQYGWVAEPLVTYGPVTAAVLTARTRTQTPVPLVRPVSVFEVTESPVATFVQVVPSGEVSRS